MQGLHRAGGLTEGLRIAAYESRGVPSPHHPVRRYGTSCCTTAWLLCRKFSQHPARSVLASNADAKTQARSRQTHLGDEQIRHRTDWKMVERWKINTGRLAARSGARCR